MIRLAARTKPLMEWKVDRDLRRRVKTDSDADGNHLCAAVSCLGMILISVLASIVLTVLLNAVLR